MKNVKKGDGRCYCTIMSQNKNEGNRDMIRRKEEDKQRSAAVRVSGWVYITASSTGWLVLYMCVCVCVRSWEVVWGWQAEATWATSSMTNTSRIELHCYSCTPAGVFVSRIVCSLCFPVIRNNSTSLYMVSFIKYQNVTGVSYIHKLQGKYIYFDNFC